jgi:predicted unusual protein kinase regulating ubiquinone biosynthesis (AarF/ABC1/UbiB family)
MENTRTGEHEHTTHDPQDRTTTQSMPDEQGADISGAQIPRLGFDDASVESIKRFAQVAGVPIMAGIRAAAGAVAGTVNGDREQRRDSNQLKNAETLFTVLGTLRGGAAKLGQALSVFEPAVPQQLIGPYREALTKLQEQLPPVPFASLAASLHGVPVDLKIDPDAVAAASLGQVHRGVWPDGRQVAVKIQYPGIAKMVRADALQLRFLGPVLEAVFPGSRAMNVVDEHVRYLQRELDYEAEARNQRRFARAWARSTDIHIPEVLWVSPTVLVTEWSDDVPLREVIASAPGTPNDALRNRAGELLLQFTLKNPERLGLVHGDPHPGNFRVAADGSRLVVLDFGAVGEEDGFTELFALAALALHSEDEQSIAGAHERWMRKGWLDQSVDVATFVGLLSTETNPLKNARFRFNRDWMNSQASRWWNPQAGMEAATQVRMPPAALLEHRALTGVLALLCQLEAEVPLRKMLRAVVTEA